MEEVVDGDGMTEVAFGVGRAPEARVEVAEVEAGGREVEVAPLRLLVLGEQMWTDPTWGVVVSGVVGSNCEVYQYPSGVKLVSIASPNGAPMESLEHFGYLGHSYIYYSVANDNEDGTANNDLYITSVQSEYEHLKVSGGQSMRRYEPEIGFPSTGGLPILFFSARGARGGGNAVWRCAIVGLP